MFGSPGGRVDGGPLSINNVLTRTTPILRGATSTVGNSGTTAVSLPSGTSAGDLGVFYGISVFSPTYPSGWSILDNKVTGINIFGFTLVKQLTGADIALGSVTFTSFSYALGCLATLAGATGSATFQGSVQNQAGGSPASLVGKYVVEPNTLNLYFCGNRPGSTSTTTMSGSNLTVQNQVVNANLASALYSGVQPSVGAPPYALASMSVPGSGFYTSIVSVGGP